MNLINGTSPQERAIDQLIHDHNGGLGMCRTYIYMLENALKPESKDAERIPYYISKIRNGVTRCQKEVDVYLEKAKNDFNN